MNRIPVIIDCDPGVDDTAALLLACQMPELDIRAVTTVAGNVGLDKTTANAKRVRRAIGANFPIYCGADKPMFRELHTAAEFHGADGFGGVELPIPDDVLPEEKAWDAIYRIAKELNGELVLIAVGPMTNVGIALAKYKELPKLIKKIVIMGGAAIGGNVTPAAEFNIYVDPEAADMMFCCGIPVHMCGLDVTMKAYITPEELEEIAAFGTPQAKLFHDVLQKGLEKYVGWGKPGAALHDPAAVLYTVYREMFTAEEAGVRVETKGPLTVGKTVTDLYSDKQFDDHNAFVVTNVDREAFISKVKELIKKY